MHLITSKKERIRFLKFSIVGLSGTAVDFGMMNLLSLAFGVPLVWAQALSFSTAVLNNFLWNRQWTFPEARNKGAQTQLIQFVLINVIGIIIRTPLISWLDHLILNLLSKTDFYLPLENFVLSQNLALAISIIIIFFWNFFANRYWTFNNVSSDDRPVLKNEQRDIDKKNK